jgi:hypothetical protein
MDRPITSNGNHGTTYSTKLLDHPHFRSASNRCPVNHKLPNDGCQLPILSIAAAAAFRRLAADLADAGAGHLLFDVFGSIANGCAARPGLIRDKRASQNGIVKCASREAALWNSTKPAFFARDPRMTPRNRSADWGRISSGRLALSIVAGNGCRGVIPSAFF